MTRSVLDHLTSDELEAFLLSPTPSVDVLEAYGCAVEFHDADSIKALRLALAPLVRDLAFQRAVETFESFADEPGARGAWVRRMLRALRVEPAIPEDARAFLDAFSAVAGSVLRDPRSRASQRRAQLLTDLLAEAKVIEGSRAA